MLIYDATTPAQQTIEGTLGEIADRAIEGRPALLIVGAVAGFRQHLRWFDDAPALRPPHRRHAVARAGGRAGRDAGGARRRRRSPRRRSSIKPAENQEALDAACDGAATFDWIVFTSVNGVEQFHAATT